MKTCLPLQQESRFVVLWILTPFSIFLCLYWGILHAVVEVAHWTTLRVIIHTIVWEADAIPLFIMSLMPGICFLSTGLSSHYKTQLWHYRFSGTEGYLHNSIFSCIIWYFHVPFLRLHLLAEMNNLRVESYLSTYPHCQEYCQTQSGHSSKAYRINE